LLPFLYDLLDETERRDVEQHLEGCAACRAALEHARGQQNLLARAAKAQFAGVSFEAPKEQVIVPAGKDTPAVERKRFPMRLLALAASVLIFLGFGIPGAVWTARYAQVRYELAIVQQQKEAVRIEGLALGRNIEAERAAAVQKAGDVHQKKVKLHEDAKKHWDELVRTSLGRQLAVQVTGPATFQPGAPNSYQVETRNRNGQPVEAHLSVRLISNEKTVLERKDVVSKGEYRLDLPPDLPLKAKDSLNLELTAYREGGAESKITAALPLAAPTYFTHLTTDKPMYRPGETVFFRSLTLDRYSLKPSDAVFRLAFSITDPAGTEIFHQDVATGTVQMNNQRVLGPDRQPVHGIGAGEFALAPTLAGGEYTLTVRDQEGRFAQQQRKFLVNKYENPRLNKKLDFSRKSYGPAAEVEALCTVIRAEGGAAVAHRNVIATVNIDGKYYGADGKEGRNSWAQPTDENGKVTLRFRLPGSMDRGIGNLSVQFEDGGSIETLAKPIPIVLKKLFVDFYPEGGELVAGVPNRVYFQARTMLDKPAELRGRVVDETGQVMANDVQTLHDDKEPGINQGMGRFTFTPAAGRKYELRIESPDGIESRHFLPEVKAEGVAVSLSAECFGQNDPIGVVLHSAKERTLLVGAYCRGRLLEHQTVTARAGVATRVDLRPNDVAGGVCRVTVFEERAAKDGQKQFVPVAERLTYRRPVETLNLAVKPKFKQYAPGERATVTIDATKETNQRAPSIVLLSIVDKSVVTMADEKTARTMPTHFLLTSEVRKPEELEYTDVLLGTHPKAAAALDLLLGTQGWRRFAEQDPAKFRQQFAGDADRLLVSTGQAKAAEADLHIAALDQLQTETATADARLAEEEQSARKDIAQVDAANRVSVEKARVAFAEINDRQASLHVRLDQLHELATQFRSYVMIGLGASGLLGIGVLIFAGVRAHFSRARAALGLTCSLVVGGLLIVVIRQGNAIPDIKTLDKGIAYAPPPLPAERLEEALIDSKPDAQTKSVPLPAAPDVGVPGGVPLQDLNRMLMAKPQNGQAFPGGMGGGFGGGGAGGFGANAIGRGLELGTGVGAFGGGGKPDQGPARPEPQRFFGGAPDVEAERRNWHMAAPAFRAVENAPQPLDKADQFFLYKKGEQDKENKLGKLPAAGAKPAGIMRGEEEKVAALKAQKDNPIPPPVPALGLQIEDRKKMANGAGFDGAKERELNEGLQRMERAAGRPKRKLRADLVEQQLAARGGRNQLAAPVPTPVVVREYAHQHPAYSPGQPRTDFAETLYWNPVLVLPDGHGEVSFDLSDSVTSFEVTAYGHTLDGRLGAATTTLESRLPFTLEPKLPIEVTAGDTIDIPVSIANNTNEARTVQARLANSTGLSVLSDSASPAQTFAPESRGRHVFRVRPNLIEGEASVTFDGESSPFNDRVTRTFRVVPNGFPFVGAHSDMLEKTAQSEIFLPETWVPGSLKCRVQVFPSTLADLQKGLESLLREPCGCFEQTSTSNYPNVLILDYLKESAQARPDVERRARELLANGYAKLTSFECLDAKDNHRRGYEWFGGTAPAHEALTAYGLMEFRDMVAYHAVDPQMLNRTREYLLGRRDGKGGFLRNPQALDTFGRAPDNVTNAYIVWALTESGREDDVTRELDALAVQAKSSKDPYFVSLVALSLINRDRADEGVNLLKTVVAAQQADGHLDAGSTSITGSGGRDLQIETTALAVLGWLKANRPGEFTMPLHKAIGWIGQQRGGYGGFGSTQSTILSLKALIAFTRVNKKTAEAGALDYHVNGRAAGKLLFAAGVTDALVFDVSDPEKYLKPGKNLVRVDVTGNNVFPYTLTWSYQTIKPASAEGCAVKLATTLDRAEAKEGETVHLSAVIENIQDKGQGMAVAIVGLPAGLTLPEDLKQLKDHARLRNDGKEKGLISHFEIRGRELILYWRDLAPRQKIEVPLDLICRVPGQYQGPASRAYLYYNADHKHWVDPLKIAIQ
jgi:hypothetical protein